MIGHQNNEKAECAMRLANAPVGVNLNLLNSNYSKNSLLQPTRKLLLSARNLFQSLSRPMEQRNEDRNAGSARSAEVRNPEKAKGTTLQLNQHYKTIPSFNQQKQASTTRLPTRNRSRSRNHNTDKAKSPHHRANKSDLRSTGGKRCCELLRMTTPTWNLCNYSSVFRDDSKSPRGQTHLKSLLDLVTVEDVEEHR